MNSTTDIRETVREKYGKIAEGDGSGCCGSTKDSPCCGGDGAVALKELGYTREQAAAIPEGANLGLGCGTPLAHAGDGFVHARQFQRVVVGSEVGLVKDVRLRARRNPAGGQHRGNNWREVGDAVLVGVRVPELPARFGHSHQCGRHGRGRYFRKTRLALCPPKPSELVITASSEADRATFGT